jgi:ankyrin repeat protein
MSGHASSPLHEAVHARSAVRVRRLLAYRECQINARDHLGRTALHWCSVHHDFLLGALLVDAGARTDLKDQFGHTPIDLLFAHGDPLDFDDPIPQPASSLRH